MSRSPESGSSQSVDKYIAAWRATYRLLREGRSFSGSERNCVFLNCANSRFANISAASGLDFPDDGRALATVDWDDDGDLDVWFYNRSGPRLRLMRNETASVPGEESFLMIKLRGTTSNRDGIGARVEVQLESQNAPKLIQTLYAGDGFLSQSSKWLHFGLGSQPHIQRVTVAWPSGSMETFSGVLPGRRYMLVEGSAEAREWTPPRRTLRLSPKTQTSPKITRGGRILLSSRLPMPILRYAGFDGPKEMPIKVGPAPLLLNFWASWCAPCLAELKDLSEAAGKLRAAGLRILSLSVDGLGQGKDSHPADAKTLLEKMGVPFDSGMATAELLEKIEIVQEVLFDRHHPFALPLNFLVDGDGRLAVIYRGRLDSKVLLRDVGSLELPSERWRELSLPFPGRWYSSPAPGALLRLAAAKFQWRSPEDTARYLEMFLQIQQQRDTRGAESRSKEAKAHYELGQVLYSQEKIEEAADHFRQAVELNGDSAEAHNSLGVALSQQKKPKEAMTHFRQALKLKPDFAKAHHNLGVALDLDGKVEEAVRHYRRAIEIDPNFAGAHFTLASSLLVEGKYEQAATYFRKVIELEARNAQAYSSLGVALSAQKNFKEAIRHFRQALELEPGQAITHDYLGEALRSEGQVDEAIGHFREALRLKADYAEAHYHLAMALVGLRKAEEAAEHFRAAIELQPDFVEAHYNLGLALAMRRNVEEAVAHFARAVELQPDFAEAHSNLGNGLQMLGQLGKAGQHFRKAIELRPDFAEAHNNLGNILASEGKLEEAVRSFRLALKANGNYAVAHNNLAKALVRIGQPDQALLHFRQAARLQTNWPAPLASAARILSAHPDPKVRQEKVAVRLAERAAELTNRRHPGVLDTLSISYAAVGRFDEAIATAQEALTLVLASGNEKQAERILERLELYGQREPYRERP